MITQAKIKIYQKYNGDIDFFARTGLKHEKAIIVDSDWYIIDSLIQDIFLVEKGICSEEFVNNLNAKLKEYCDNNESIKMLEKIGKN